MPSTWREGNHEAARMYSCQVVNLLTSVESGFASGVLGVGRLSLLHILYE